jgi:hypothetical protein
MPECNQTVSDDSIGLTSNNETISHIVPQAADIATRSDTTETSPNGDLPQRPLLPFVSPSFHAETTSFHD